MDKAGETVNWRRYVVVQLGGYLVAAAVSAVYYVIGFDDGMLDPLLMWTGFVVLDLARRFVPDAVARLKVHLAEANAPTGDDAD